MIYGTRGGHTRRATPPPPLKLEKIRFVGIKSCCIEYTSSLVGFELTMLVVVSTDCIGSCTSNCHTITTMTTPYHKDVAILRINMKNKLYRII